MRREVVSRPGGGSTSPAGIKAGWFGEGPWRPPAMTNADTGARPGHSPLARPTVRDPKRLPAAKGPRDWYAGGADIQAGADIAFEALRRGGAGTPRGVAVEAAGNEPDNREG